ncbi:UDP-Glc:alpha-D-GlcNAc-diphosphoundecaprenol beta-1,3-glucosyltransferase WfgD [Microbacterium hydrocarbonoxydans]|uniref:UDP-Glc:alpha-D-GlcNAc-diphosphoundecaprenol beta-1,3-glucosyltransferase WfgD n=1 Tax=Microbacterium hydrocarbonoxydans TaxID=273678 RepID=A0A0M2HQC0_9MICO|nr:glycosyltransferase family 2 protein [Microbacterium hydrocarbonoxydans]KJL47125.1 UDP-Glc:alpha-D-GlcNAc-diphosphoundecaprenol beta-1,3-glucosyltransferase WfgD [Microbacterium hydrocarbonoxydans]
MVEVSVVLPTHNRPELMKLGVESVLAQGTTVTGEVVIVFDACPVEVPDVPVPDGWIVRGISNTRSRGLAGARNSGILAAEGRLVAFLDDDDEWLPGKLDAQLRRFAEKPDAMVVGTAMVVDDGDNRIVRRVPSDELSHEDFLRNRNPGLHSSSLMFRREVLLGDLGLIDEELPRSYGEDYDILLRGSALGLVTVVNEPLVRVLWNGQSYYFGQWAAYAEALQYLLAKHPDFATIPAALGRIEAQVAFALASAGKRKESRSWAWRALRHNPGQVKAALALAISWKLVTPQAITKIVQKFGRGI